MNIINSIMEAKAAMLKNGVREPFTIRITSKTLQQLKAEAEALRMIEFRDSGRQMLIGGMIIEVDDSCAGLSDEHMIKWGGKQ